ncbi:hypothetical protein AYI73_14110 [Shewanella algae]|nr:hypothetical protein AYI73_14110 [Shewanella algae]
MPIVTMFPAEFISASPGWAQALRPSKRIVLKTAIVVQFPTRLLVNLGQALPSPLFALHTHLASPISHAKLVLCLMAAFGLSHYAVSIYGLGYLFTVNNRSLK